MAAAMGSLTECNVCYNDLDREAAASLARIGTERRIMLCGIRHNQTEASFSAKELGPEDALLVASDLSVSSSLLSLNLRANQLGSEGASVLARAIAAGSCSLTSLDLSENILTDHGRDLAGIEALSNAFKTASSLTTVRALHIHSD